MPLTFQSRHQRVLPLLGPPREPRVDLLRAESRPRHQELFRVRGHRREAGHQGVLQVHREVKGHHGALHQRPGRRGDHKVRDTLTISLVVLLKPSLEIEHFGKNSNSRKLKTQAKNIQKLNP